MLMNVIYPFQHTHYPEHFTFLHLHHLLWYSWVSNLPRPSPDFLDPFQQQNFPMPLDLYQGIKSHVSREIPQVNKLLFFQS